MKTMHCSYISKATKRLEKIVETLVLKCYVFILLLFVYGNLTLGLAFRVVP